MISPGLTMRGILAGITALVFYVSFCRGQEWGRLLSGDSPVRNATLQFYTPDDRPAMNIRVQRIHTDYEQHGFLKIGMLPLKVLAGTTVTVQDSLAASNSLAELHQWLGPTAARRVELRNLKLLGNFSPLRTVEAGRARFLSGGTLELSRGVRFVSGTNEVRASRGQLRITGPGCGELTIYGTPAQCLNFFGSTVRPSAKERNHENLQSQSTHVALGHDGADAKPGMGANSR